MALAAAKPGLLGALPYAAPYVAAAPIGIATSVSSQYHAQDTLGQYSYGYSGGPSAKTETRTADGITRGGYSYIDGHGLVQSASYVSDPVNGFRVAATNLPVGPSAPAAPIAPIVQAAPAVLAAPAPIAIPAAIAGVPLDTPEVAAAKAAHFAAHVEAKALLGRKKRSPTLLHGAPAAITSYAAPIAAAPAAYATYAAAPIAAAPAAYTTYAAAPIAKSFGYSTVTAHADPVVIAAPAPAPAPVAVVEPVKSFGYSTVSAHADPVVVAAPAPAPVVTVARAAPVAFAAPAPAPVAVVEPVKSFGYSTISAHANPLVVAAPAPAVSVARAAPVAFAAPAPAVAVARAAPLAVAAPVVSGSSQYQAQDTLGQYSYGYADSNSQKQEVRTADGATHGAYSYVDGHGLIQSVKYHADGLGFRVAATNLPVGPAAP
jgi:hypothetical protein